MTTVNLGGSSAPVRFSAGRESRRTYNVLDSPSQNGDDKLEQDLREICGIKRRHCLWGAFIAFFIICVVIFTVHRPAEPMGPNDSPNFIVIVLDGIGWADVSWKGHDSAIPTRNIDYLFQHGLEFTNFHTNTISSSSRAELLTGQFAYRFGMQTEVNLNDAHRVHIPEETSTFAELLVNGGYVNHYLGKWHVGFADWAWTPLNRGWDSWIGSFLHHEDYMTHKIVSSDNGKKVLDFWNGEEVFWKANGSYTEDIFFGHVATIYKNERILTAHRPFSLILAPQTPYAPNNNVPDSFDLDGKCDNENFSQERRNFCSKLVYWDYQLGVMIDSLQESGLWDTSWVMLTSVHGGAPEDPYASQTSKFPEPDAGFGNNWPFRGGRGSWFQGGTRVPFVLSGGLLVEAYRGQTDSRLSHLVDITATMLDQANIEAPASLDGLSLLGVANHDNLIMNIRPSRGLLNMTLEREDGIIFPVDYQTNCVIYHEKWKWIEGKQYSDGWFNPDENITEQGRLPENQPCYPEGCLFNLDRDPNERANGTADEHPDIVASIKSLIEDELGGIAPGQDYTEFSVSWTQGTVLPYLLT